MAELRFKKLEQELQKFVDCHKEMESLLQELRRTVKEEGMKLVTDHMKFERSEAAKKTIDDLNEMGNLTFKSNARDIEKYVMQIFDLNDTEEEAANKQYTEEIQYDQAEETELSLNGNANIEDVKGMLGKRGFHFRKAKEGHLEFQRNEDFYFVIPVFEAKTEEEIKALLNVKFRYRNIGFVCANNEIKSTIRKVTEEWTKDNDKMFHYLIVHFASFHDIELTEEFFETINYTKKKRIK